MVNPHDVEGTADAIHAAIRMPLDERRRRMRRLREIVRREDIFWWTDSFLAAAFSRRLDEFPVHEYFVPQADIRSMTAAELEH
jgi:trehalose 6-phosphate synthase/phosphatase